MTPPRPLWLALLAAALLVAAPARAGWTLLTSGTSQDGVYFQISAVDAQHAMAVGVHVDPSSENTSGALAVTTDGQTWTQTQPVPVTPSFVPTIYTAVTMVTPAQVFVGGLGRLLASTDGGGSWTVYTEPDWGPMKGPEITGISFADTSTGVFVGAAGTIRKTTDGGGTWTAIASPVADVPWAGALLRGPSRLWLWGGDEIVDVQTGKTTGYEKGALVRSTDVGATFEVKFQGQARLITRVSMVDDDEGYLISRSMEGPTLEHTTDGGTTWRTLPLPGGPGAVDRIQDVVFFDSCEGLVIAELQETSSVYRTADGGTTWTPVPLDGLQLPPGPSGSTRVPRLATLAFLSRDLGFVGGSFEVLGRYTPDTAGPDCGPGGGGGGHGAGDAADGCGCRAARATPGAAPLCAGLALAWRRRRR